MSKTCWVGYGTFDAYYRKRWDFNSSRVRQLIAVTEITDIKSVTRDNAPAYKKHVRPLMCLAADQQCIAWAKAEDRSGRKGDVGFCRSPYEKTYGGCLCYRNTQPIGRVENIKNVPIGTFPATETQCRSLTHLTADQRLIPPHGFMQGY
jgi:hypothetical protein